MLAPDNRLATLVNDVEATGRALHLTLARVEWLVKLAARTIATEEDLEALERVELTSMLDTVHYASPMTRAPARRTLDALGLSAPDVIPATMTEES